MTHVNTNVAHRVVTAHHMTVLTTFHQQQLLLTMLLVVSHWAAGTSPGLTALNQHKRYFYYRRYLPACFLSGLVHAVHNYVDTHLCLELLQFCCCVLIGQRYGHKVCVVQHPAVDHAVYQQLRAHTCAVDDLLAAALYLDHIALATAEHLLLWLLLLLVRVWLISAWTSCNRGELAGHVQQPGRAC